MLKKIRFTRNTIPHREGGPGYKAGDVVQLPSGSCERWIRRDAAEYVTDPLPVIEATNDVEAMDSAADVAGAHGGSDGERAEPDAEPSQPRRRGRPPGRRNK